MNIDLCVMYRTWSSKEREARIGNQSSEMTRQWSNYESIASFAYKRYAKLRETSGQTISQLRLEPSKVKA